MLGSIALRDENFGKMVLKSLLDDNERPKNIYFLNQTLKQKFHVMLNILKSDKQYKEYRHFVGSMLYVRSECYTRF